MTSGCVYEKLMIISLNLDDNYENSKVSTVRSLVSSGLCCHPFLFGSGSPLIGYLLGG